MFVNIEGHYAYYLTDAWFSSVNLCISRGQTDFLGLERSTYTWENMVINIETFSWRLGQI